MRGSILIPALCWLALAIAPAVEAASARPVFIGPAEAQAIALAVNGIELPRPGTHDLFVTVLHSLDTRLERVTVTELVDATFHAELTLATPTGTSTVSCRPSDGIALAVRVGAAVHVEKTVMEIAAVAVEHEGDTPFSPEEIDRIVDEFQGFLETAEPGDFADTPDDEE